jgi:hypothetical protein
LSLAAVSVASVTLALASSGCGGAEPAPVTPEPAAPPKPRNAGEIAMQVAGARIGAIIHVDKAKGHRAATGLLRLPAVASALSGTGIDPLRDVDRAFVCAPHAREQRNVIGVLEHHLSDQEVRAALDKSVQRSRLTHPDDGPIAGLPFFAVKLTIRNDPRAVALVEPGVAVVLPAERVGDAKRFIGTGGLPFAEGTEAAQLYAAEPATTLRAPGAPRVPPTIGVARGKVWLKEDGSVDVVADGTSTTPEQARADAEALTEAIADATSVRVAIVKVRLFRPVPFKADDTQVRGEVHLSPSEVDQMLSLLATFVRD